MTRLAHLSLCTIEDVASRDPYLSVYKTGAVDSCVLTCVTSNPDEVLVAIGKDFTSWGLSIDPKGQENKMCGREGECHERAHLQTKAYNSAPVMFGRDW